jgi:hypothetical protein
MAMAATEPPIATCQEDTMTRLKGITVVMGLCAVLTTSSAFMAQSEGYVYGEDPYGGYPYYPDDGLYDFDYGDGGRSFEPPGFDEHAGEGEHHGFGEHGGEGERGGFGEHGGEGEHGGLGEHGGFGGNGGFGEHGGGGHR